MKRYNKNIKITASYILPMIFCVLFSNVFAQSAGERTAVKAQQEIKPLHIGDRIPEELWNLPLQVVNHPDGKDTITLNDYRSKKLIILDFWATWCSSCIKAFPLMDSIQSGFLKDLAVLLINVKQTRDTKQKVESFITSYQEKNGNKLGLTSVVEETNLRSYFAFKPIPHYVWIKDDKVVAMTSSTEVTFDNVNALLEGNEPVLHMKIDDLKYDSRKPSFWLDNGTPLDGTLMFRSLITGYQRGYYGAGVKIDQDNRPNGMYYFNFWPIRLYRIAYDNIMGAYFRDNRIIVETDDERFAKNRQDERHIYTNSFCYELNMPNANDSLRFRRMRIDLEDYFRVSPVLDKRVLPCLFIKSILKMPRETTEESKDIISYSTLISLIDQMSPIPVVNDLISDSKIKVEVPKSFSSLSDIVDFLKSLGIEVVIEKRLLDVVILKGGTENV